MSLLLHRIGAGKFVQRDVGHVNVAPMTAYAGSMMLLGAFSLAAFSLAMQAAIIALPENTIDATKNRVETVAYQNKTSLRRVSELKSAGRLAVPVSFQSDDEYASPTFKSPSALLPEPQPAELVHRLTVFLGGDSEQVVGTTDLSPTSAEVISVPIATAVAGYLAECEEGCLSAAAKDVPPISAIQQSPNRPLPVEVGPEAALRADGFAELQPAVVGLEAGAQRAITVSESVVSPISNEGLPTKFTKRGTRFNLRNAVVPAGFSPFKLSQMPKMSRVRLAQVDLFTIYLIGPR